MRILRERAYRFGAQAGFRVGAAAGIVDATPRAALPRELPQGRKAARVSRLWRVRGGSRAFRLGRFRLTQALYNRIRPRTFAQVVGQEHVTDALSAALTLRPAAPRVPVQRSARLRQDLERPHPGRVAELRHRPDPDPVRRLRALRGHPRRARRWTSSRSTPPATAASTTRGRSASGRSSCRRRRVSRSTSSTRRTRSPLTRSTRCSSWSRSRRRT